MFRTCKIPHATCSRPLRVNRRCSVVIRAVVDDDEMDSKVADFLADQDLSERGMEKKGELKEIIGQDEVDDEQAKMYCRDIIRVIRTLETKRDMELREIRLVVQIDDPRNDDARKMGIEDSSGVSRDELGIALNAVAAGQIPKDRIALRVLHAEMINWPFLDSDEKSSKAKFEAAAAAVEAAQDLDPADRAKVQIPDVRRDPSERPKGLAGMLPDWMGYSGLYIVTLIPVMILGTTVAILFFSSLK